MALSFEESKKLLAQQAATPMMMSARPDVMTLNDDGGAIAAYSGETWTRDTDYRWFNDYVDDKISHIDENKNITVDPSQVNISQETNSQFIPFEMMRKYDGIDLSQMAISIHYTRSDGSHGASEPVNVEYTGEKIRFVWLVDDQATCVVGNLKFEIHADGDILDSTRKSYGYRWKSKSTDKFNIIQSLCADTDCDADIVVTDNWVQDIVTSVANKIGEQIANAELSDYATDSEVQATVNSALTNYYTKTDTDLVTTQKIYTLANEVAETYATKTDLTVVTQQKINELANEIAENYYDKTSADLVTTQKIYSLANDIAANYSTKEQFNAEIEKIDKKIGDLGDASTVVKYVQDAVDAVDISDKLGDLNDKTVKQYVDDSVAAVDVSEQLKDYATTDSLNDVKTSLETVRGNTVTNAANILTTQNDIAAIQSSLSSLKGDNENLIIQYDEVGSILHLYEKDENGDIIISDGEEQIKVKEIYSTIIIGAGGGGSSLVATVKLGLRQDGEDSFTVLYGDATSLNYNLSTRKAKETQDEAGNDVTIYEEAVIAGDITLTLYRNNVYLTHFTVTKNSSEIQSGSVDISDYVVLGNQVFTITASYVEQLGSDGETITIRSSADWAVNAVNLKITNLPDSTWETTPKYGSTTFSYTPVGALEKTIYFKIDEKEPETVVTSLNGTALTYTIPQQTHGVHTLQVWCEGNVGGTIISTEPVKYVLMFVENGNNTPIIRVKAPATLEQYSSANIYYNVFDPLNAIIKSVTIYDEDGVILSSVENITSAEQRLEFRPSVVKNKTITIKYKEITESVTIEVTKFPYEINAVTGNLMVDFVPTGRTNSDADYNVFKNNAYTVEKDNSTGAETQKEIPMTWTFSENFDWINGGWKTDANGDSYFCIKSGTFVDFNYNLFGTDGVVAKQDANGEYTIAGTGKEFKLIFKTTNVAQANATWLQCIDTADKKSLGIRMEAQNAYIDSGLGTLEVPYVDNDIIEFDMNIIPMTKFLDTGEPNLTVKTIPMIMTYEDGTPVQPKVISSPTTSFKQDAPKPITIGSEYCDVHIYRMKVYERYLEDKEIITNFIADARSGVEMANRYVKNDIYPLEDKQKITPESVAAACPDLKVYILSAPHFTNDKDDKIANTTIKQIHNTGTKEKPEYDINENWTATGATHNGQGTSSNEYGYSGRNLEFNLKKATITLNDNTTVVNNIQLSPTSYPTNYLNFKINIASSENANNSLLQKRYDRYLPYTSVASLIDDRKKNSMEFFNCVVFIQETDENLSTHREFNDTDVHFYGIGNIGDSKKTDDTRVNDVDDVNEFCVEIMDWNRYLSSFPADTMVSTLYVDDDGVQVLRFEDLLVDANLGEDGIIYEKDEQGNYYHSTDTTVDKTKPYYIDILENDDFSEDYTYGFRYIQKEWKEEDGADYKEKNEAFQKPLRQKWIEFYRFVTRDLTTNGVEDAEKVKAWKSEFSNWFILDSALYYYLYTLRYTMVDNRAKNTFWHWGKHYLTLEEAIERGIAVYDEDKNLITSASNPPSQFYDANGNEIKNINAAAATINDGYRMDFWAYDNDTALGIDNAGKLEIPYGVEDEDVDFAGVPYFRAHDSLVFVRIAKYFVEELESVWHNTEINPVGKVFDSTSFINEFDAWQNQFPEELWRLDYERKYKRTYVGGVGQEWDNALPQSNTSDVVSTRFLTEMMNGRKKYQRRCFERNQEIYMSSKFKGEVNLGDTITLRGTGRPTGKVVTPNFTLNITPFSKMYVNLYSATDKIYYHEKCEAGVPCGPIPYPETTLDFIYIRGASQLQSLGDLSPMYLQTAELTSGTKLKAITLGNATTGYSNDSLKTLQIGAGNKLLEELDIRNLSNLNNTSLPVSNIPSLKYVYAQGSNISEAVFANNGLLEEAYLPATITRLELRNLNYLKAISLESYNNLLHLVVIDCSDMMNNIVLDMINQAPDLKTLRATNIDWELDDTAVLEKLYNLITNFDSPEVVLAGKIHAITVNEQELYRYQAVWPDLKITWDNFVYQYIVTFVNADEDKTVLHTQYVTQNGSPLNPTDKNNRLIPDPTLESTPSTRYEFVGWDYDFENPKPIVAHTVINAVFKEHTREYTIKYVSNGITLQEDVAPYGSVVYYRGETPTNTSGENNNSNTYRLFNGWDKFGYVDGDKTINAVYDTCICVGDYFAGKDISEMRPVEIYAMLKMHDEGLIDVADYVESKDKINITLGNDISYSDIAQQVLIDGETMFNGSNYIDKFDSEQVLLLNEDRDFVVAIDYSFDSATNEDSVIAQCYVSNGQSGFRLMKQSGEHRLYWGDKFTTISYGNNREILVLRHIKGENGVHVYSSNMQGDEVAYVELDGIHSMVHNGSLRFGCGGRTTSLYEYHAQGSVYWSKVWYADLGHETCLDLVAWPHDAMNFSMCGFNRYLRSDNPDITSTMSFLSDSLLPNKMQMNHASSTTGGWDAMSLNAYLNNRIYNAFPQQWKQLLQQVKISSTNGNKSLNISDSDCYIAIPAVIELNGSVDITGTNVNAYNNEGYTIDYFAPTNGGSVQALRQCYDKDGNAVSYWTRSPNVNYANYQFVVNTNGSMGGYEYATALHYVRIIFSI